MAVHKPIKFREPSVSEYAKNKFNKFISEHPYTSATKALFALALAGGVLTTAVIVPGIFHAVGKWKVRKKIEEQERYRRLWESFYRLKKEHTIKVVGEESGGLVCEFTREGEHKVKKFLIDILMFEEPSSWDRKWRIIIFDIPEFKRGTRIAFQKKLFELGCYQLQKSVWVYPFPCEAEINFLKEFFNVGVNVLIFRTEEMPSGKALYHFKDLIKKYL